MSTLYLVATPIGNMEDVTLRALRILAEVPLVAAEDTRHARRLLDRYDVKARLVSYNDHNRRARTPQLLRALDDGDLALVTDAGMPGISDPGHDLVVAALDAGHDVVPVPGASAVTAAVAASGLPSRRFHYLGFLPKARGPRRAALRDATTSGDTIVIFESPHRLRATLADALDVLGDRRVAVCRELTKRYEETWRGTVSGALAHFPTPRGEFTLVLEGAPVDARRAGSPLSAQSEGGPGGEDARAIAEAIAALRTDGASAKDAVALLTQRFHLTRRQAYRLWHD